MQYDKITQVENKMFTKYELEDVLSLLLSKGFAIIVEFSISIVILFSPF